MNFKSLNIGKIAKWGKTFNIAVSPQETVIPYYRQEQKFTVLYAYPNDRRTDVLCKNIPLFFDTLKITFRHFTRFNKVKANEWRQ